MKPKTPNLSPWKTGSVWASRSRNFWFWMDFWSHWRVRNFAPRILPILRGKFIRGFLLRILGLGLFCRLLCLLWILGGARAWRRVWKLRAGACPLFFCRSLRDRFCTRFCPFCLKKLKKSRNSAQIQKFKKFSKP